jgi:opine dehydrogenase
MTVSVIGGGHGGYAAVIEMVEKGFDVTLWRRNGNALRELSQLGHLEVR